MSEDRKGEMGPIVDAFLYGERIQIGDFKDAAIHAVIKGSFDKDENGVAWFLGVGIINEAYSGTPQDSPPWRLLVDLWA